VLYSSGENTDFWLRALMTHVLFGAPCFHSLCRIVPQ
jgi:hypothetical protein